MAEAPKVMFIDDDVIFIDITQHRLEHEGMSCVGAQSGEAALDMLKKDPLPDIILLDLMMPGINGFDLLKLIKQDQRTARIPVIAFSNDENPEDKERVKSLGAAEFLEKVRTSPHEIAEHVKNVLQAQHSQARAS